MTAASGTDDRIDILGPCVVTTRADARPLTGKPLHVLSILIAASPSWVSHESLIEEVWSDRSDSVTRGALHQAITRLRKRLGALEAAVLSSDAGYRFETSRIRIDVTEFSDHETHIYADLAEQRQPDLDRLLLAEELWTGRPFEGVDDLPRVNLYVRQLNDRRLSLLERTLSADVEWSSAPDLSHLLSARCEDEPYRESLWLLLARMHGRHGRIVEAIRTLDAFRTNLAELGMAPTRHVSKYEAELFGSQADDHAPASIRGGVQVGDPNVLRSFWTVPQRGRAAEMRIALQAFADEHRSASVIISGPAGLGKTHMVAALAKKHEANGGALWFHGFEPSGSRVPPADPEALPDGAGMLAIYEDLHWADSEELGQLGSVLLKPQNGLTTILTGRPNEGAWESWLDRMGRSIKAVTVTLHGLDRPAIEAMASDLGAEPDRFPTEQLWRLTAGNPFLICESVRTHLETGSIGHDGSIGGAGAQLIRSRIASQSSTVIELLEWIAVAGGVVDLDVLVHVTHRSRLEIATALDDAVTRGLLREVAPGILQLCHDLLRGELLARLSLTRRSTLHREIAAALMSSSQPESRENALRHTLATGDTSSNQEASDAALALAEMAVAEEAWERADALAKRAIDLAAPGKVSALSRSRAHLVSGHAAEAVNAMAPTRAAAVASFAAAIEAASEEAMISAAALSVLALSPGEPLVPMIELLEQILASEELGSATRSALEEVRTVHLVTALQDGTQPDPRQHRRSRPAEPSSDTSTEHQDLILQCRLLSGAGLPDAASQLSLADRRVSLNPDPTARRMNALLHRLTRRISIAQRRGVEADLQEITDLAVALSHRDLLSVTSQIRGALSMADGDYASAARHVAAGLAICGDHPVNAEIGIVQQWWLSLIDDPSSTIDMSIGIAAASPHRPVMAAMAAYNYALLGDRRRSLQLLEQTNPLDGSKSLPRDVAFSIGVAGSLHVACATGSTKYIDRLLPMMRPFDGQLIFAVGFAFPFGAAARSIAIAQAARGEKPAARHTFARALALESAFDAPGLVAQTELAMETWL